ncbi:EF-hand domain-containing protein [Steroidobacter sp.]|uniref:EF-hand domain-containing protein n=1 Tax=Steroidobacter sp. TaxID=1978227 RepID=UPI001A42B333|nr:EF-hand domain-containing protein [Steroidobacter sp.]MBL8271307.1 EF-hand domain-containing protein [Steroidobacter sp.]
MFVSPRASAPLMVRRALHICSLAVALSLGVAHAAEQAKDEQALPTGGHAGNTFISAWDDDGDGKVSRTEYENVRIARWATADGDKDGSLTVDEYLNEYAVRLDQDIADERNASLKQTDTRFKALDKDGDKFVSRAEYNNSGDQAFVHLDRNKDGRITQEDAEPADKQTPRRRSVISMPTSHNLAGMLEIYDDDGDDVLTREQYNAQRAKVFAATDSNKDGKLDHDEYANEFIARLNERIAERRQAQLKQGRVRFKAIDADQNGRISREEYFAMSARMFERADTNKDGLVTKDDPPPPRERRDEDRAVTSQVSTP